jgi:hypothetical protein
MDTRRLHAVLDRIRDLLPAEHLTQLRYLADQDTPMCVMELVELHAAGELELDERQVAELRALI